MGTIYDRLDGFDKDIAAVFRLVTGGKPDTVIGAAGAQKILDVLLKDGAINGLEAGKIIHNEAAAILTIMEEGKFDRPGGTLLVNALVKAIDVDDALIKGLKPVQPDRMHEFTAPLGWGIVGKISFSSPGTKIRYTPGQYAAIRGLLMTGEIQAYVTLVGPFADKMRLEAGSYRSDINRLIIHSRFDGLDDAVTLVHEATHAIQDWLDLSSNVRAVETDAHIVGALAAKALGIKKAALDDITKVAIGKPADLVLAGKAMDPSNADWKKAYDEVADAVAADNTYRAKIGKAVPEKPDVLAKGAPTEPAKFAAWLAALQVPVML